MELKSEIPKPTAENPHPRLLGSLRAMLTRHYRGGMTMETLSFDKVRADDPSIAGDEDKYVDFPADALPEPTGSGFWWHVLPPSGK